MYKLENKHVELTFDEEGHLVKLQGANGVPCVPIDADGVTAPFEIQLRGKDGIVIPVTPRQRPLVKYHEGENRQLLQWYWEISDSWGRLTVKSTVVLPNDEQLSYWTIEVENKTNLAIFQVAYPRISGLVDFDRSTPGWLAAPDVMGEKTPNPVWFVNHHEAVISTWSRMQYGAFDTEGKPADIAYAYPGYWSMQFLAYGHPDVGGIYFAAYDPQALYKCFGLYQDGNTGRHAVLQMKQYPYDRTALGANFKSFYECPVGIYHGEWWNASKIYRKWALKQFWVARGPIAQRTDIPAWIKENDLWYWNWQFSLQGHPNVVVPLIKGVKQRYNCNMAFHWYGYNGEVFGYSHWRCPLVYPGAPDIVDALAQGVKDLHEAGVHAIYYLECRLVNPALRAFRKHNGMQWICTNEKGESADYWPGLGHTMCPTAPFFHNLICDENNRMIEDFDLDGVYLDQVTGCYPAVCFQPHHGHGIGGHDHWVRGYREMMTQVRNEMRARRPDTIMTSEGVAECFLDLFDIDLSRDITDLGSHVGSPQSVRIPMFHSVYHDYHMSYGSVNVMKPSHSREVVYPDRFRYGEALALVGGGQPMFSGIFAGDENKPKYQPFLDYMQTIVAARKTSRPFFNMGRWLPPLKIACELTEVNVEPDRPKKENVPAVISGCFEFNGEVCVVVVNHTDRAQRVSWQIRPEEWELHTEKWRISQCYPEMRELGNGLEFSMTMPPQAVQVYRLKS